MQNVFFFKIISNAAVWYFGPLNFPLYLDCHCTIGAALVHSGQVAGSDVEFRYGYTVILLTLHYVHELSIRRLLFVYTTEG
jgi:hypothetical protein